ncbi:UDP-galactopyranose mutase [Sphingomonas aerophila]|uniref:UDP-galactopyranose mutase n=1 Tax=Sphingomonas aerophila TaxID=1344948 RepID=A0A7W9EVH0_9SPHN|nr:UDP-galactopyranose mutase [Sphingomonas aerophila]MBB5716314.1 UDP-galactopyranose mutase [Sphingomonas aerophila]
MNAARLPASSHRHAGTGLLVCFSHLRWNFVFQRPQHLLTRFARHYPVVVWEEPEHGAAEPGLLVREEADGLRVVTPQLPHGLSTAAEREALGTLLDGFLAGEPPVAVRWYYTPMMLAFSRQVRAAVTVYDCMDELSAFRFAPAELLALEEELLRASDLVFTGGYSLYEAKQARHPSVHPFPSSVDVPHFARARDREPGRQATPRLGFYGVIDERMDLELLGHLAAARPEWQIEVVGPVVKIDPSELPRHENLHYPGSRSYDELPATVAGWDVALMPFAINEATRFISPTKTPEYLAAGRPVVSTPVVDVVRHYGSLDAVRIAEAGDAFVQACDEALALVRGGDRGWRKQADAVLAAGSWDDVAAAMLAAIRKVGTAMATTNTTTTGGADRPHYDYLVVGAGFAGSVMAERLAADAGKKVLVIDRRPHVAGNAYDVQDESGILIHQYGPHIFHTNSDEVFSYLSRFTEWRPYEHRVLAEVRGQQVPIPINRTTLNKLFDAGLETDEDAAAFLAARAEPVAEVRTSEDVVVSAVGEELYRLFFRGYTRKQWGLDPSELDKSVTARVPTRTNLDDRYFGDTHQAMPAHGFTAMFTRMLDHPNITVMLDTDFAELEGTATWGKMVYTGPIDEYFGHRYGKLPYRSLRFEHRTLQTEWHQAVAVVNYPDEAVPYTRVTEYKHLTGQDSQVTSVTFEYPASEGDPYYPIPRPENQALFKRYEALSLAEPDVIFVGRLATYRYYNMDQVVGQALATYRRLKAREEESVLADAAE